MKFDTIIIGGGLAGLVCGIRLQQAGQKTAIISAGQSAIHFSSGTFDLLGRLPDGTPVDSPLEVLDRLPATHPYAKISKKDFEKYALETKDFFAGCGIKLVGSPLHNSWRITPVGEVKPCWLGFEDLDLMPSQDIEGAHKVLIANFLGYMDFNTQFLSGYFTKRGIDCRVVGIKSDVIDKLRKNPTEMRSSNIARVMDNDQSWKEFATSVKDRIEDEDLVVLPAVFGLKNRTVVENLRKEIGVKTIFVATMPPSVPGIRAQMQLKNAYSDLGGQYILGDTVEHADIKDNKVAGIYTSNFEDLKLQADNYVLATGNFFSKGLVSDPYSIKEPIIGLDIDYDEDRNEWYDLSFFNIQNYMSYGVKTDNHFHTYYGGEPINNLYAVGSVIGGANALYESCGGGVCIMTALKVADTIADATNDSKNK